MLVENEIPDWLRFQCLMMQQKAQCSTLRQILFQRAFLVVVPMLASQL